MILQSTIDFLKERNVSCAANIVLSTDIHPINIIVHFSRLCEVLLLQKLAELKGINNNVFYEINFLNFEIRDFNNFT